MSYTRRDFAKTAIAALPLASSAFAQTKVAKDASKFGGVQIAVQTYSYRSLRNFSGPPLTLDGQKQMVDRMTECMVQNQINACEFWIAFVEPFAGTYARGPVTPAMVKAREDLRKWRESHPMEIFEYARKTINSAGISIYSCMFNLTDYISDAEIESAFETAKTLGTNIISANCTVKSIKRAAPFADKHKTYLAAHSENAAFDSTVDGMVFGDNLVAAMQYSPYMRINLDCGHFTAYGGDAVEFVKQHHDRIINLHLKDRYRNHPEPHTDENTPEWGKGDAPLKQVLQLMKKEHYPFAATIEYEYKSDRPAVEEVQRCLDYARAALA